MTARTFWFVWHDTSAVIDDTKGSGIKAQAFCERIRKTKKQKTGRNLICISSIVQYNAFKRDIGTTFDNLLDYFHSCRWHRFLIESAVSGLPSVVIAILRQEYPRET